MNHYIKPITRHQYNQTFAKGISYKSINNKDVLNYFKPFIEHLPNLMQSPFYWRVYSNSNFCLDMGGNVNELCFATKEFLMSTPKPVDNFIASMYEEDVKFIMAAVTKISGYTISKPFEARNKQNFTIYGRLLNAKQQYVWMAMQYPLYLFDDEQNILGGIIVYSLVDTSIVNLHSAVLTINDYSNNDYLVYKTITSLKHNLSYREGQIVALLKQGQTSAEIAHTLKLSVNTINNHRQRLLKKFNASSSLQLIEKLKDH